MNHILLNQDELQRDGNTYEFEGYLYEHTNVSFILVDVPPGSGPRLHSHPYEEILIVLEGRATYVVGSTTLEVKAVQIVIVPPGTPHKFVNSGEGPLRQVDIHVSRQFITEWLEA